MNSDIENQGNTMKITDLPELTEDLPESRRSPQPLRSGQGVKIEKTITINRPVAEVYAYWSEFENLPKFMKHLRSVRMNGPRTSHWVLQPSANSSLEWDAEIIEDRPGEVISWKSLPGSDIHNAGSVWFKPMASDQGTEMKVSLKYDPPGGKLAAKLAKLMGEDAAAVMEEDLARFKTLLENGGIPSGGGSEV